MCELNMNQVIVTLKDVISLIDRKTQEEGILDIIVDELK